MLLVDGPGIPLSIIVTAANHHDLTQLEPVLDAIVCRRPRVGSHAKQHLCADAGFRGAPAAQAIRRRRYIAHVRSRREEHRHKKRHPARRWVVEEDWTRKELVPIEAVFASIEAKHTLEIEGESRSSLTHAFEQAGKVRALCEQRTQVPMNQIAPG